MEKVNKVKELQNTKASLSGNLTKVKEELSLCPQCLVPLSRPS